MCKTSIRNCVGGFDLRKGNSWGLEVAFERNYDQFLALLASAENREATNHGGHDPTDEVWDTVKLPQFIDSLSCGILGTVCHELRFAVTFETPSSAQPEDRLLAADGTSSSTADVEEEGLLSEVSQSAFGRMYDMFRKYADHVSSPSTQSDGYHARDVQNRTAFCYSGNRFCEPVELFTFHDRNSEHKLYNVLVSVKAVHEAKGLEWMGDVMFEFVFKNSNFAFFECVVRFLFLGIVLAVLLWFVYLVRHMPIECWRTEQKWMMFLLTCLTGYNDPLFVLLFVKTTPVLTLVGILLRVTFTVALIIYWLVTLEGLTLSFHRRGNGFHKFMFSMNLWLCLVAYEIFVTHKSLEDPFFAYTKDFSVFWPLHAWLLLNCVGYAAWLFWLLYLAGAELRHLHSRKKLLYAMTIVVVIATLTMLGIGATLSLPTTPVKFVAPFALINSYVVTAAVLYMPAQSGTPETFQRFSSSNCSSEEARELLPRV
eukprot:Polyplicarium_translucidae@DN3054_c0_g1_i1.p1